MPDRPLPIRVLIVDDSQTARSLLVGLIQATEGMQVVGTGAHGEEALPLVKKLSPDVVLMDIRMPRLDGLEATRRIMREAPTRIIIVSGSMQQQEVELTFQALRAGALAVLHKPGLSDPETCEKMIKTVEVMAKVPVIHHWGRAQTAPKTRASVTTLPARPPGGPVMPLPQRLLTTRFQKVAIASSTGGPAALAHVLGSLTAKFPLPIVMVQHISTGFASGLAQWLGTISPMKVEVASHGEAMQPGVAYLAPDDYHLRIAPKGIMELNREVEYKGLRPSANHLFESLAQCCGPTTLGIMLTGMGDDGADGMTRLHEAGAITIAQDEETSIVYGMPHEAVLRGAVDYEMSLDQIAYTLQQIGRNISRIKNGEEK